MAVNYIFGDKPADNTGRGSVALGGIVVALGCSLALFAVRTALWLCFLLGCSM